MDITPEQSMKEIVEASRHLSKCWNKLQEIKKSSRVKNQRKNSMPALTEIAQMHEERVFAILTHHGASKYFGHDPEVIKMNVGYNEGVRYLTELVLQTDEEASYLSRISEGNSSQELCSEAQSQFVSHSQSKKSLNESMLLHEENKLSGSKASIKSQAIKEGEKVQSQAQSNFKGSPQSFILPSQRKSIFISK